MPVNESFRVAVIGAGPAGIAAAIQLRRQGLEPLLLEKERPGGLLRQARWVENYPGFPAGISGPDLADLFWEQAAAFDLEWLKAEVLSLESRQKSIILNTTAGGFTAARLVLASGSRPRALPAKLNDPQLAGLVLQDLNRVRTAPGRSIAVLGSGDAAFDYALNLAGSGCRVFILLRGASEKCLSMLAGLCRNNRNIEILYRSPLVGVCRSSGDGLLLFLGSKKEELEVDALLAAIGRQAEDSLLRGMDNENRRRLLAEKKIISAGDVKNGRLRQTALAVGDGIRAAMIVACRIKRNKEKQA